MDGRDTSPNGGKEYLQQVETQMEEIGVGKIASVCGRYWGMDRDNRWERINRAYNLFVNGEGLKFESSSEAINYQYNKDITDEFLEPSVITAYGDAIGNIQDGDAVFFFNFRADRAREISIALNASDFEEFPRSNLNLHYSTMTLYREDFKYPTSFQPEHLNNILGDVIAQNQLKQFRIAETEKYAHVTFFFNGGEENPFAGEDRELIPSPKVATYDLQPEMSAPAVSKSVLKALEKDYSFILLNLANPDMVGHTGVEEAVIRALEAIDPLVEGLVRKAREKGFVTFITADHGNSEQMKINDGKPHTAHTTNKVPFVVILPDDSNINLTSDGRLSDVAPSVLHFLGIQQPLEMTGKSLIVK